MIGVSFLKEIYARVLDVKSRIILRLFGNTNYKKFVIISDARTGSTLLMGLLNNHPEIIAMGETFKRLGKMKTLDIWNDIFRNRSKEVKWVGFKLFYDHPWNSDDRKVWDLIEEDKEIVVIHLVRKNKLRSYVSKQIGLKTKLWTENSKNPKSLTINQKRVEINIKDCLSNLEKIENNEAETKERYNGHKLIPVTYEELSADKNRTMQGVFSELGVDERVIATSMIKQNSEGLKDLILNYEELYAALKETRWNSYFNDGNS